MGRFLRLLVVMALIAYVVGRFTPNFRRLLKTITTTAPGYVSHRSETASERSSAELSLDMFHGCGIEGDARSLGVRALDRLKNRYTAPSARDTDSAITLEAILAPGNDISRWKVKEGAEIIGYVSDVKRGGVEATNCHARDDADRDTHIELVLNPMHGGSSLPMIVDVLSTSPRWWLLALASAVGIAALSVRAFESEESKNRRAELKRQKELRALADRIATYGKAVHQRYPTGDVVVSERDLAAQLRKRPEPVITALNLLLNEDKVQRAPLDGYWKLNA